jgi:C1A family cysteine protease
MRHINALPKATPFDNLKRYSVSGTLNLPYAEISEPFRVWFDIGQSASRIDYYDGMVSTIQLAPSSSKDFGTGIKIIPMTTEQESNIKTCIWLNGTNDAPVTLQSVIPDTTDFAYIGISTWKGYTVDQWQTVTQEGDKKNTYTFYINTKTGEPLFYEMIGYDSLLGSHYDRYYIEYYNWSTDEISPTVFTIHNSLQCTNFPGPGIQNQVSVNPMREFFHGDDSYINNEFGNFKKTHDKKYDSELEHKERLHLFRNNLRYIQSINRKGLTYTLAVNHLADKSDEELIFLTGKLKTTTQNNGLPFDMTQYSKKQRDLPTDFDWRIYGAVTPVKDPGVCGSSWSFGTTGPIEGALFVKHRKLVRLSSQNLIDCTWGFGNNGCDGGEDSRAYDWIIKHGGIATEESYGQYLQQDGYCHFKNSSVGAQINGYVNVTQYDAVALKTALVNQGPISIAIDAGHKSMIFYANGVYFEPTCGNGPDSLDHSVLLVGYGNIYGQDYWLVKNSWSTYWGNDGYILMSQKDNNCGVTTMATFPLVV